MHEEERWEMIFNQLNGAYVSEMCEGVRDETSAGGELAPLLEQAYAARDRLSERLGVEPAYDPDFEALVSGFKEMSRVCGQLMYRYGYRDGAGTL